MSILGRSSPKSFLATIALQSELKLEDDCSSGRNDSLITVSL